MRVLIACEFSGIVRDAIGPDAISCDLLPTESEGPHIEGDVLEHLEDGWDMMIAFPPCTHLASSGARWFKEKQEEQKEAVEFFMALANAPIPKICIENPIGVMSRLWRKPDQIIQPWMFGHECRKSTCLWLKGLPKLVPTNVVGEGEIHVTKSGRRIPQWYNIPPREDRWRLRSRTFPGIARAMAEQWFAAR